MKDKLNLGQDFKLLKIDNLDESITNESYFEAKFKDDDDDQYNDKGVNYNDDDLCMEGENIEGNVDKSIKKYFSSLGRTDEVIK